MYTTGGKTQAAALIALSLAFLVAAGGAYALPAPAVTFIPDKFSQNGSFVAVADPGAYDKSIRVTWASPDEGMATDLGLFPREDDSWICYFSNTDTASTCGPTPFRQAFSGYTFIVRSVDRYGNTAEEQFNVSVGRIKLTPEVTISGGKVQMNVYTSESTETIEYAVYDSDFQKFQDYTGLEKKPYGNFVGTTNIDKTGTYYLAFRAENLAEGTFGGEARKITIGGGSGSGYISADIQADSVSFEVLMNSSQTYTRTGQGGKSYTLTNIGSSNLTSLHASPEPALSNKIFIEIDDERLKANESTHFTVMLKNIKAPMKLMTSANITSNGSVVGRIPLMINVSLLDACSGGTGECPACPVTSNDITIEPATWMGEYVVGTTAARNFTVTNNEDFLVDITGSDAGSLDQYISVVHPASVAARSSREMTVEFTPLTPGTYSGSVAINTDKGPASIVMYMVFYSDISDDIADLRDDLLLLEDSSLPTAALEAAESQLDGASTQLDYENYRQAESYFQAAAAQVDMLKELESGGYMPSTGNGDSSGSSGGDMLIPILVIVLVVLVGVFIYLKKFKGKSGESGFDEELEEDGGY